MVRTGLCAVAFAAAVLWYTGCGETPKTTESKIAEAKKDVPPEPVAGQSAFYQMYKPARTWATDVMPLSLAGDDMDGIKSEGGKYPRWVAVFVSPGRREARTFFYAVADRLPQIHKGVTIGGSEFWSGSIPKSRPFTTAEFNTNSDKAYQAASDKAGPWLKEHSDKKLTPMLLVSTSHFGSPVWYVMWGDEKSGYRAYVSATTGMVVNPSTGK